MRTRLFFLTAMVTITAALALYTLNSIQPLELTAQDGEGLRTGSIASTAPTE